MRIRGYEHNVIQIWNTDSELHSKSSVGLYSICISIVMQHWLVKYCGCSETLLVCVTVCVCVHICLQVIQRVKELVPSIEINEFYQCECGWVRRQG